MNLLKETIDVLESNGKKPSDVVWVGTTESSFDWEWFARIADIEYEEGFGGQEIATDLLVVGTSWWLERHEYDGSEWWEYKSIPIMPKKQTKPLKLKSYGCFWKTIEEMNSAEQED